VKWYGCCWFSSAKLALNVRVSHSLGLSLICSFPSFPRFSDAKQRIAPHHPLSAHLPFIALRGKEEKTKRREHEEKYLSRQLGILNFITLFLACVTAS